VRAVKRRAGGQCWYQDHAGLVAGRLGGGFGLTRLGFRLRDLAEPS
jgi:hypothetical protein